MDKRIRSPNYPALSLSEAIERIAMLYKNQHTHAAPREMVAKGIGYNSLNGASATAISALHKYGLLERVGDEVKLSERAMSILHPHSPTEKVTALRAAASDPKLFAELAERFPEPLPSDDIIRNYLLRHGFAPGAVSAAILAYRDTVELVKREAGDYDSASTQPPEQAPMDNRNLPRVHINPTPHWAETAVHLGNARDLGHWDFEGGGSVRIMASGDVATAEALDMAELLIKMRRQELQRSNLRVTQSATTDEKDSE